MKVNFNLKSPKVDFETWIVCKVTYQRKQVRMFTDKKIHPKFWNPETQRVRQTSKFPINAEFNDHLNNIENFILKLNLKWENDNSNKEVVPPIPETILKESVRKFLTKTTVEEKKEIEEKTFWSFYDNLLQRMEIGTRVHVKNDTPLAPKTIFQYHNLKRHLQAYEKKKKVSISFECINMTFYNDFTTYLTITKGLAPNTIGKLITMLKVLLREANEDGITDNNIYTHRKFKSISSKSDTIYLTIEEIKELQKLELSAAPRFERVRDVFIVGCYTGLRFSDLTRIQPQHIENGMIEIAQAKTGGKVFIPMVKDVLTIMEKYKNALPKISNQKYNEYLHEVCKKCDILQKEVSTTAIKGGKKVTTTQPKYELVCSHTARRSFATNEYRAGDLEISEIMAITGHTTEKSFYKYIREKPRETALRIKDKFKLREMKQQAANENNLKAV